MQHNDNSMKDDLFAGPGHLLRQGREAKGLTIDEVSNKLYLSKQRVIDIENDNYDHISSTVYARGYLRSYAKLIELSGDEVLNSFLRLGSVIEEPKISNAVTFATVVKQTSTPTQGRFWLITTVVTLAVVAAVTFMRIKAEHKLHMQQPQQIQQSHVNQLQIKPTVNNVKL